MAAISVELLQRHARAKWAQADDLRQQVPDQQQQRAETLVRARKLELEARSLEQRALAIKHWSGGA